MRPPHFRCRGARGTVQMIYRVIGEAVYVLLGADGRRDMQDLLTRRLLEG